MIEPLFWLGLLSILLAVVSLTAVLVAALPAYQELARAARSAEKLFDTLSRELPPTLEAIRLTGLEISDLTDDINDGVQSARNITKQVDQSIDGTKQQIKEVEVTTRSVFTGVKAAWRTLNRPSRPTRNRSNRGTSRSVDYFPNKRVAVDLPQADSGSQSLQETSNAADSMTQENNTSASNSTPPLSRPREDSV